MLKNQLPSLYQKMFPKSLLAWQPNELKATCDNCAMTIENQQQNQQHSQKHGPQKKPSTSSRKPVDVSYLNHLKCCTFHPFQPNYLVGGLLETQQILPRALNAIETKIKTRSYALPIGLLPPVPHQVEFNHRKKHEFGQREDWLCPYYEKSSNNCGIWKFRGAVCTTFFCKSSHGQKGLEFWDHMSNYLTYVEAALMEEALVMLDFSPRQISDNLNYLNRFEATPQELKMDVLPLELAKELWNGYYDDQVGFYKKCFAIVSEMNLKDFKVAMGDQGQVLEKELMQSLSVLKDSPAKPRKASR